MEGLRPIQDRILNLHLCLLGRSIARTTRTHARTRAHSSFAGLQPRPKLAKEVQPPPAKRPRPGGPPLQGGRQASSPLPRLPPLVFPEVPTIRSPRKSHLGLRAVLKLLEEKMREMEKALAGADKQGP